MAITALKLQNSDFDGHRVANRPDKPAQEGYNAQTMKAAFDDISLNVIAPRINEILDALTAATAGDSGAHNIGSATIAGAAGSTVYQQLLSLVSRVDSLALQPVASLPDHSITDLKLASSGGNIIDRYAAHRDNFMAHMVMGTAGGTNTAYTLTNGSYTWAGTDGLAGKPFLALLIPTVDCGAGVTLTMFGDTAAKTIVPASGGAVGAGQMKAGGTYLLMWNPTTGVLYLLNPETRAHTHAQSEVTNLATALSAKSDTTHLHTGVYQPSGSYAAGTHSHAKSEVSGLQADLDSLNNNKSPVGHNHTGVYQPVGSYQPAGNYQPAGSYQAAGNYVAGGSSNVLSMRWDGGNVVFRVDATDFVFSPSGHGHMPGNVGIVYSGGEPGYVEGRVWLKPIT